MCPLGEVLAGLLMQAMVIRSIHTVSKVALWHNIDRAMAVKLIKDVALSAQRKVARDNRLDAASAIMMTYVRGALLGTRVPPSPI
eukprot:COSAG01_NODE_2073_length_8494_cov_18.692555_5_plen_85_part_00